MEKKSFNLDEARSYHKILIRNSLRGLKAI
jgi:hypothetical protein